MRGNSFPLMLVWENIVLGMYTPIFGQRPKNRRVQPTALYSTCMCTDTCTCLHVQVSVHVYVCTYICRHMLMCPHTCAQPKGLCACGCAQVRVPARACACTCGCACAYAHVQTHMHAHACSAHAVDLICDFCVHVQLDS